MSREEDSFRMHVHILPNEKWVCNFCGYEYSGDTTRIRAHLAGVAGYGIQGCENVDSQVRSKALTAWKGKRPAKSSNRQRYLEGGPHLRATPNDEDDCIVTSFAALPDLTSDVISTVAPSSSAFLPLPETVNNEDDWTVTLPVARPDPSSGVMSTVNARSSAFLPLPKTNLPNQSLPPQNMNPQRDFSFWPRRPQSHAVDSYLLPRSLSHLIRVIRQPDLVSKDLTNMLRLANAKVEEPNTKVPQGTLSRDHKKKIKYGSFGRKDSLSNGGTEWRKIGKIHVSRKEIAKGSNGTIVLEGIYEGRPVAVKRLVRAHCDVASNEIQILLASDQHKNIVRYHGVEYDPDFVYLALERCACSLDDLIQVHSDSSNNSAFPGDPASTDDYKIKLDSVRGMMQDVDLWRADGHPSPLLQKLMRNVVSGLSHLHDLRIIHRDLKPQNVLITKNRPFCAQLSDMGISKCLPKDKSSLGYHATGCGTSGWRAPELLLHGGRQTPAMDAFSLGCVLCFCFTRGRHPFGENLERDHNIVCNKMDLSFVDIPEAHDLFSCLLNQDPKLSRPKTSEVLHHPFFWSSKMRLTFLHDISDEVESEARKGNLDLLNALENIAQSVFDGSWDEKIDKDVMDDLRQHRRMPYDGSCVRDLLRVVRNKFNHLRHAPEKVKAIHGSDPNGLDAYFAKRFSRLLIESYKVVSQSCKKEKLLAGVLSK
ncbi:serine/threonine-protein kinase/endoribonuclease IRE1a-like isoform X1 [Eucalyptus grandis]|uniref:serine/threonine-protein kinase/endoribonuclease IRE1a-like isoform X1 n=1 Tax=Eucalyptus grandis TaxID=71139 RepID=UPI00192EA76B|nr:serine/threonine-protein kinase/endoribonuclease IRE1a-like isoform X1 [Eucalyptus grandis]